MKMPDSLPLVLPAPVTPFPVAGQAPPPATGNSRFQLSESPEIFFF